MTMSCPHFALSSFSQIPKEAALMEQLKKSIANAKYCQICKKSTKSIYICLNPDCLFVGCGRDDKKHAMEHFKSKHVKGDPMKYHHLALHCNAFHCWCYQCDDMVFTEIFDFLDNTEDDSDSIKSGAVSLDSFVQQNNRITIDSRLPSTAVGFYNLGNSCYMNAALQALLSCPSFFGFFQKCGAFIYRHHNRRLSEHFHKLVDTIASCNVSAISPSLLVKEVKMINPMFHGYSQQDTMDFLRCILEKIHEEMKSQVRPPLRNDSAENSSPRRRSQRKSKSKEVKDDEESPPSPVYKSIISDTFGGILRSEIDCQQCHSISTKEDIFFDVSIPICSPPDAVKSSKSSLGYFGNLLNSFGESIGLNGKPVKLEACLEAFCAPETLDGKDRYKCEKCKELVESKKTLKFKRLPEVLCIQLKRFRHESYFLSKVGAQVIFPLNGFDMTPYVHKDEASNEHNIYSLTSIITHYGSFNSGHYVAFCKSKNGQWLEYNDSNVRKVSPEEVCKTQAYSLFYTRDSSSAQEERISWIPKITSANPEKIEGYYVSRYWYNEWISLSDPGPLDNSEVQCKHKRLIPEKLVDPIELVQYVPKDVYTHFISKYGERSGMAPLIEAVACDECIEEERQLDFRRKKEEKDIQLLDTSSIKGGEHWYLMCSEWLTNWNSFKVGGSELPGPICNDKLVDEEGNPRPNLIRGNHYRGVNKRVWDYFYKIYGGGPTIIRDTINLYSTSVQVSPPLDDVFVDVDGHD